MVLGGGQKGMDADYSLGFRQFILKTNKTKQNKSKTFLFQSPHEVRGKGFSHMQNLYFLAIGNIIPL